MVLLAQAQAKKVVGLQNGIADEGLVVVYYILCLKEPFMSKTSRVTVGYHPEVNRTKDSLIFWDAVCQTA